MNFKDSTKKFGKAILIGVRKRNVPEYFSILRDQALSCHSGVFVVLESIFRSPEIESRKASAPFSLQKHSDVKSSKSWPYQAPGD